MYFMDLPDTLLPSSLYDEWKEISVLKDDGDKEDRSRKLVLVKFPYESRVRCISGLEAPLTLRRKFSLI